MVKKSKEDLIQSLKELFLEVWKKQDHSLDKFDYHKGVYPAIRDHQSKDTGNLPLIYSPRNTIPRPETITPLAQLLGELFYNYQLGNDDICYGKILENIWEATLVINAKTLNNALGEDVMQKRFSQELKQMRKATNALIAVKTPEPFHLETIEKLQSRISTLKYYLEVWGKRGHKIPPDERLMQGIHMLFMEIDPIVEFYENKHAKRFKSKVFMPYRLDEYDLERKERCIWDILEVTKSDLSIPEDESKAPDDEINMTTKRIICQIIYFLNVKNSKNATVWTDNIQTILEKDNPMLGPIYNGLCKKTE